VRPDEERSVASVTDETNEEGDAEAVEDLEAPAAAQADVVGGADTCGEPSFYCMGKTCVDTIANCTAASHEIIVREL
jgi:hypothetical protein